MCSGFLMFCSGNLFYYDVQMANKNFHKLRFKAIFGLERTISTTSVQYFIFLLGFGMLQMGLYCLKSLALGWSFKACVPLTKDSPLFYPLYSYGLPCINRSDLDSKKITGVGCRKFSFNVFVLHSPILAITNKYLNMKFLCILFPQPKYDWDKSIQVHNCYCCCFLWSNVI